MKWHGYGKAICTHQRRRRWLKLQRDAAMPWLKLQRDAARRWLKLQRDAARRWLKLQRDAARPRACGASLRSAPVRLRPCVLGGFFFTKKKNLINLFFFTRRGSLFWRSCANTRREAKKGASALRGKEKKVQACAPPLGGFVPPAEPFRRCLGKTPNNYAKRGGPPQFGGEPARPRGGAKRGQ